MFHYNRSISKGFALLAVMGALSYALFDALLVSQALLNSLQVATIFIGIASKLPQVYGNFAAKSTGTLSITTTFLQFAGTGTLNFNQLRVS